jgi:pimeloyl-ACP methyl ester carboxylesterase
MGASVIWSYIDLFGNDHLAKIIIVDQSPRQYYSSDWKWGSGGCYDAEALAILCTRLEYDAKSVSEATITSCLAKEPTSEELNFFTSEMVKCPGWVQAAIMTDHTNLDWRDLLPEIRIPALVLVGRKSRIFPWQGSAFVGERIPGARTVFFENSGHMPFYEEPEKFNQVVGDFVGRGSCV